MIPKVEDTIVISTLEGFETQEFSAEFSGWAAKILYDGLYTNKPQSILRELATNAYDSHVEAGIPERPFILQLPTMLDSTLRVRDFGVSMTHEQTMKLYTTIFASSKKNTNQLVGQFGLGSKSPFSYTDSFVVTCWRDGIKRTYVASLTEEGMPILTHLSNEESDEETGMEVSFPVQAKHFGDFKTASRKVALGFDVTPLGVEVPVPIFSRDNWRVFDNRGRYEDTFMVRQGCVNYPVAAYDFGGSDLVRHGYICIVDVPIGVDAGGVDIIASREALSMDDQTKANVKAAWTTAKASIEAFATDIFESSKNFLEASQLFVSLNKIFFTPTLNKPTRWKQKIDGFIRFDVSKGDPALYKRKGDICKTLHVDTTDRIRILIDRGQRIPRKALRVANFFRGNDLALRMDNPTSKDIERVMRRLGLTASQFTTVEKLDDVQRANMSSGGPSKRTGIYLLNGQHPYKKEELPADPETWFWAPIPSGIISETVRLFDGQFEVRHLDGHLRAVMQMLGIKTRPIYGLTPLAIKRGEKTGEVNDANNLTKLVTEKMDEIKEDFFQAHLWWGIKRGGYTALGATHGTMRGVEQFVPADKTALIAKYKANNVHWIVSSYCLKGREQELNDAVDAKVAELYHDYPMLFSQVDDTHVTDYINQRTKKTCPLLTLIT